MGQKIIEIALASFADVRTAADGRPDLGDCLEISEAQARAVRAHEGAWRAGDVVIVDPRAVSAAPRNYGSFNPRLGIQGARANHPAGPGAGLCQTERNGGTPQPGCDPVPHCGGTPLGFNTFQSSDYPLAGAALGAISEGPEIEVKSGRARMYTPQWLYVSARDTLNNFALVPGYITSATVNEDSQLAGSDLTNRPLSTDLYINGPLQLDNWHAFGNTSPETLQLRFGSALGPTAELAFSGAFWGTSQRI